MSQPVNYPNPSYPPPPPPNYPQYPPPQQVYGQAQYPPPMTYNEQPLQPIAQPVTYVQPSQPTDPLVDQPRPIPGRFRSTPCTICWVVVFFGILVVLQAITYFAAPTWYRYCYFYVGPVSVWPGFTHWSSADNIHDLKDKVCTDGYDIYENETDQIAYCLDYYCPKMCHYLKNDIPDAASASNAFSGLYIIACVATAILFLLTFVICIDNRTQRTKKTCVLLTAIGFLLIPVFNFLAFVTFVGVGDWNSFDNVEKTISYEPYCWFQDDDDDADNRESADSPHNLTPAGTFYWAIILMILNILISIRGMFRMYKAWKNSN